jgi:hypothetical protein
MQHDSIFKLGIVALIANNLAVPTAPENNIFIVSASAGCVSDHALLGVHQHDSHQGDITNRDILDRYILQHAITLRENSRGGTPVFPVFRFQKSRCGIEVLGFVAIDRSTAGNPDSRVANPNGGMLASHHRIRFAEIAPRARAIEMERLA